MQLYLNLIGILKVASGQEYNIKKVQIRDKRTKITIHTQKQNNTGET